MATHDLASTNLKSCSYVESTKTLTIEFHSGAVYEYYDVPRHVYRALYEGDDAYGYFDANIKGVYSYNRVRSWR